MHAQCGELLESVCTPGANVLDVGSGSGYLTAVLAQLVGPQGRVTGVEVVPELVERSRRTLAADPATRAMVESGAVSVHVAEGSPGWPANAPYDAIHGECRFSVAHLSETRLTSRSLRSRGGGRDGASLAGG